MNHALEYAASIHPPKWTVYGVRLHDFTVGHKVLLDRIESPVLSKVDATVNDVATAIAICSLPYADAARFFFQRTLAQRFWHWRFTTFAQFRPKDAASQLPVLQAYIDDATQYRPPVWRDEKTTKPAAIPETLLLRVTLLTEFNYAPSEIMDLPYPQALMEYYGLLDRKGAVQFRNPGTEDFFQRIKKQQQEMREMAE